MGCCWQPALFVCEFYLCGSCVSFVSHKLYHAIHCKHETFETKNHMNFSTGPFPGLFTCILVSLCYISFMQAAIISGLACDFVVPHVYKATPI